MKNLLIIGAGGFGREVYSWASSMPSCGKEWKINGFLDDNLNNLNAFNYPVSIISSIKDYEIQPDDIFTCAIGNPETKQKCIELIKRKGGKIFINIIHPTCTIANNAKLGEGVILCPMTLISADTFIGNFVSVNVHSSVGHDSKIGDWTQISSYCDITGKVIVGESVFFGSSAKVLPGLQIGDNAIVGAGSIVVRKVEANTTVFGNPAKAIVL